MKIAFATTQSINGSTLIGRVLPLAKELSSQHKIHVLGMPPLPENSAKISFHPVGKEPFTRTKQGKKRLTGIKLALNMLKTSYNTYQQLSKISPDIVVIVKTLPHNVLGVLTWSIFNKKKKVVLDVDDSELSANVLTSLNQRAVIHWAERAATNIADSITVASPFLQDHFGQLSQNKKPVTIIPTGIYPLPNTTTSPQSHTLLYIGSVSISSGHRVNLLPEILRRVREQFPNTNLVIAGDGDDTAKLTREFKEKDLIDHVVFNGRFSDQDIPKLLSGISIIIDPIDDSISNRAKSSFRITLAGVTGTATVSSDIGIRPDLLPSNLHDRMFAIPGDAESYAERIIGLFNNPLSKEDSQQMISHSKSYQWDNLGQKFSKIIES